MDRGRVIPRQATCVAIGGRALLIEGAPGIGKTSLALALIDRGAALIGDDGVMLEARADALFAAPHPHTRGLVEVRNLGILTLAAADPTRIALVIRLDPAAPRHIDTAASERLLGIAIPVLMLTPGDAMLPIKAEIALARFGLLF